MAMSISGMAPVAHLPLILGMLRKLEVAAIIDTLLSSVPRNVFSCGRGVEALLLDVQAIQNDTEAGAVVRPGQHAAPCARTRVASVMIASSQG